MPSTGAVVPDQGAPRSRGDLGHEDVPVAADRGDPPAVGRERDPARLAHVAAQAPHLLAGRGGPQGDRAVLVGEGHERAVGRQVAEDDVARAGQGAGRAAVDLPEPRGRALAGHREQPAVVAGEGDPVDLALVAVQRAARARAGRREPDHPVGAAGGDPPPVGRDGELGDGAGVVGQPALAPGLEVEQRDRGVDLVEDDEGAAVRRGDDARHAPAVRQPSEARAARRVVQLEVLAVLGADPGAAVRREGEEAVPRRDVARHAAALGVDRQRARLGPVLAVRRIRAQPHQRLGGVPLERAARLGEQELVGAPARHVALGDHALDAHDADHRQDRERRRGHDHGRAVAAQPAPHERPARVRVRADEPPGLEPPQVLGQLARRRVAILGRARHRLARNRPEVRRDRRLPRLGRRRRPGEHRGERLRGAPRYGGSPASTS